MSRPVPLRPALALVVAFALTATASVFAVPAPMPIADPLVPMQWGLEAVNASAAWSLSGGGDVVVAVVDSGADLAHVDLAANLWGGNIWHGTSTARPVGVFGTLPVAPHHTTLDDDGHGTRVAGIVAAVGENGVGVRGVAQVPVMVVKVSGVGAPGHAEAVADGIRWAVDHGARVVSMSLAGFDHAALRSAVQDAWCRGAVLVAASGNEGAAAPRYPAAYPEVVAVGAVAPDLALWSGSNRGAEVLAPGVDVLTTAPGNTYLWGTGTSYATPFAAGVAALAWSANPALSNQDVRQILDGTARDVAAGDGAAGLLDAGAAVTRASAATPSPAPSCT